MRHLCVLALLALVACSRPAAPTLISYTTTADSSRYYYRQGWQQIMDQGDYQGAEASYRMALSFDPDFLLGKSVLARLSLDLPERIRLYRSVEAEKHKIRGPERQLLDIYQALTHYTNLRDQHSPTAATALQAALQMADTHLGVIARQYPEEPYLKAEYVEIVHALRGAAAALDTLHAFVGEAPPSGPFLLGFRASLYAELGQFEHALADARRLSAYYAGREVAKPEVVLADIYYKKGEYARAKIHADRALRIAPRNLDASRLSSKIQAAMRDGWDR